jgi:ribosomal subunit interface protein
VAVRQLSGNKRNNNLRIFMQLSVKGKQIDVGDALRSHVETQLNDVIGKYFNGSLEAQVTFSREAHMFRADITVHAGRGITLQANASASEAHPAFDIAADRIATRLRRYKKKIIDHHHHQETHRQVETATDFVLHGTEPDHEEEANDNPVVVAEMTTTIEILTVGEAVMRLDLGDLPALMFRNRAHNGFNMIYRRPDGHIGWIDPAMGGVAKTKTSAKT